MVLFMNIYIGVINIWPVKTFENVHVIKGYNNNIELNGIELNSD